MYAIGESEIRVGDKGRFRLAYLRELMWSAYDNFHKLF
jgi:hypothetical protein